MRWLLFLCISAAGVYGQWQPFGNTITGSDVRSIAFDGTTVVACGLFSSPYNFVAMFNTAGGAASAVPGGVTLGGVGAPTKLCYDVAVDAARSLWIGGSFTEPLESPYFAAVNLATQTLVNTSGAATLDERVEAVAPYTDGCFLGGQFFTPFNKLAFFRSSTGQFEALGGVGAFGNTVSALVVHNDVLYIGSSAQVHSHNILQGSGLTPIGNLQTSGLVTSIAVAGSDLIIGGSYSTPFSHLTAIAISSPATARQAINATVGSFVMAVCAGAQPGEIYVGGTFTSPYTSMFSRVPSTTGIGTRPEGSPNGNVRAVAYNPADGYVYAGGEFTLIGGNAATYLGRKRVVVTGAPTSPPTAAAPPTMSQLLNVPITVANSINFMGNANFPAAQVVLQPGASVAASGSVNISSGASLLLQIDPNQVPPGQSTLVLVQGASIEGSFQEITSQSTDVGCSDVSVGAPSYTGTSVLITVTNGCHSNSAPLIGGVVGGVLALTLVIVVGGLIVSRRKDAAMWKSVDTKLNRANNI